MHSPNFFDPSSDVHAKRAQFRIAAIKRAAFYPISVFWGYAVMSLAQYNIILTAVAFNPNLFIAFTAASCLTLVLCFVLEFFMQKYITKDSHVYNIAHGLLYFADLLATVYVASLFITSPASVYFLFALAGAGVLPTIASFALLEKAGGVLTHQFVPTQNQRPTLDKVDDATNNFTSYGPGGR